MKKYNFFIYSIILVFGGNAFLYFFSKLLVSDYHLIGGVIDTKIPLIPEFIYFYMIWYPLSIITLYIIYRYSKKDYLKIIIALVASLLVAHITYYIYPTMVDRPIIDSYNSLTSWMMHTMYLFDTPPVNCLPSVHCLICFLIIFGIFHTREINKYFKWSIIIVNILIVASTLLVKQHVLIDVYASLALALIAYYGLTNLKFIKSRLID